MKFENGNSEIIIITDNIIDQHPTIKLKNKKGEAFLVIQPKSLGAKQIDNVTSSAEVKEEKKCSTCGKRKKVEEHKKKNDPTQQEDLDSVLKNLSPEVRRAIDHRITTSNPTTESDVPKFRSRVDGSVIKDD